MKKQKMIDSAEGNYWLMRRKFEAVEQEYIRFKNEFKVAERDWENAKRSFEEGERVKIELNPDNHGHSENYAFGKILEVYLCGAKYKVLLDSGETKTFNSEFVSKIDMRKL